MAGYPGAGNRTPSARAQREKHWRRVVARQQQSGLTRADFCRREGIKNSALSWWAHELRERDGARPKSEARKTRRRSRRPAFVPVRVIETAPPASVPAVEVVTRAGHVIRLGPGFDPATLRRAVAALEGQPC
jgi:hypothetical protein